MIFKKPCKITELKTIYDIKSIEIKIHEKFKKFVGFGNDFIFLINENSFLEKVGYNKVKFSMAYISTKNGYSYPIIFDEKHNISDKEFIPCFRFKGNRFEWFELA